MDHGGGYLFLFCSWSQVSYGTPGRPACSDGMARLCIRHETLYTYERPVRFAPHRLLLRPRDSHAIRVLTAHLTVSPPGETRWMYDALGNSVCSFTPRGEARSL